MTLKDFYSKLGDDYNDVLVRLISEERIKHFVIRFLEDNSFDSLCESLKNKDYNQAFNSAHNLKGIAQNLGFNHLAESADEIGDALRQKDKNGYMTAHSLINKVTYEYKKTISAINLLKADK